MSCLSPDLRIILITEQCWATHTPSAVGLVLSLPVTTDYRKSLTVLSPENMQGHLSRDDAG